jgi:hypothetical protein
MFGPPIRLLVKMSLGFEKESALLNTDISAFNKVLNILEEVKSDDVTLY